MNTFYTNCVVRGNNLLYRGVCDDKRMSKKIPYKPTLFLPSKKQSKFTTLDNKQVESIKFDSIKEANDFISRYEDVDNFEIYGNNSYNYVYLSDTFPDQIEIDLSKIVIAIIDIEVASNDGFPEPKTANQSVLSIALKLKYNNTERTYVYGMKDYTGTGDFKYIKCDCEQTLLQNFIRKWTDVYPDVVTGWNSNSFDFLYLINRIDKVYPNLDYKKLSPWGSVFLRERKQLDGSIEYTPEILGVSLLDYLQLYKKFSFTAQESYRLDYIGHAELGERKLNYDEYSNLGELYQKDFNKFAEYNVRDVNLVDMLEQKLNLLTQSIQLAVDTKVNFDDVFMQVRMWDQIIYDHFRKNNLVYPFKKKNIKTAYAGAYVKDPIVGFHKWIVSLDVNSMYPNLIIQHNISPDTITGDYQKVDIQDLINKRIDTEFLIKKNVALTANGQQFRRDKQGILPQVVERIYKERVKYKKLELEKKKELELIEAEIIRRKI